MAITEQESMYGLCIFPNPATDKLSIHVTLENSSTARISLYNIQAVEYGLYAVFAVAVVPS